MESKDILKFNIFSKINELSLVKSQISKTLPSILGGKLDKEMVQFEFNFSISTDVINKIIKIKLDTQLFADVQKTIKLGYIITEGEFEIKNLDEIVKKFEGKIPNFILANFIGIVVGTARGFLITKSKGTIIQGVYMPMINPLLLLQKPAGKK